MATDDEERPDGECIIPPGVPPEALNKYLLKRPPQGAAEDVRQYVEWEAPDENVTYVELVKSERVMGTQYDTWDVHTTGERYWVITDPTNLYSQRLFPSADYTLSFHIGLAMRVTADRSNDVEAEHGERLSATWRRWTQAAEALDVADEAEEYQAVGMRCREALLTLVRDLAEDNMVPPDQAPPKLGDFIHWAEHIARSLAPSGDSRVRSYLNAVAPEAWRLAGWLTHERSATRMDAELVLDATRATLHAYSVALLRVERGEPDKCPRCGSYMVATRDVEVGSGEWVRASACQACSWTDAPVEDERLEEWLEEMDEVPTDSASEGGNP